MSSHERRFNLELIISLVIVMGTIVGTTVPLYLHTDSKMDVMRSETREMIEAIQMEIRDFHTRLYVLEEKNRKQ